MTFDATHVPIYRFCLILLLLACLRPPAFAQIPTTIVPDKTLGTMVTEDGNLHTIDGGTPRGSNLFHSFDRFDIGAGDTARFTTQQTGIHNILSRVTGGHRSMIDGRLQSDVPDANLYLLNPSGVVFGSNARLDVRGSFHVSTADVLRLQDGGEFHADLMETTVLTLAPPSAFGFLRDQPSEIAIDGARLAVPDGAALSLVGGNIRVEGGKLTASQGQLNVISVVSRGDAVFQAGAEMPTMDVVGAEELGEVTITKNARLSTSGEGGGTVLIRGRRLRVDAASIAANTGGTQAVGRIDIAVSDMTLSSGGQLRASALEGSRGAAGTITVRVTGEMTVTGRESTIDSGNAGSGPGGLINLRVGKLSVRSIGAIDAGSRGRSGHAGSISIAATDSVTVRDRARISASTEGRGRGGDIMIDTADLTVRNRAVISANTTRRSEGGGDAGRIEIHATDRVLVTGQSGIENLTDGSGNGGDIMIDSGDLTVRDGASISANAERQSSGDAGSIQITAADVTIDDGRIESVSQAGASGNAGDITLHATGQVLVTGGRPNQLPGQIRTTAVRGSQGSAGSITITADTLSIVTANTSSAERPARITSASDSGDTGDITIEVCQLSVTGGSFIAASVRENAVEGARGGNIRITATERITVSGENRVGNRAEGDYSRIDAETLGRGHAGNVILNTPQLIIEGGGRVFSAARATDDNPALSGRAGVVTITATDSVTLTGRDRTGRPSGILTSTDGSGNGGNIMIDTGELQLLDGGEITAQATGRGDAGSIKINVVQTLFIDQSEVRTNALQANGGGDRYRCQLPPAPGRQDHHVRYGWSGRWREYRGRCCIGVVGAQ